MNIAADYPKAVWTPGPNFGEPQGKHGRNGHGINSLCVHGTASPGMDIDAWAALASRRGGAHYMVGRAPHVINGVSTSIIQMVREADMSWGNGQTGFGCMPSYHTSGINPNLYTISIEFVKLTADNSDTLTASQQSAGFDLILYLCRKYGIPAHFQEALSNGITMHMLIDPIRRDFCPGVFPWADLFTYLHSHGVPGAY